MTFHKSFKINNGPHKIDHNKIDYIGNADLGGVVVKPLAMCS